MLLKPFQQVFVPGISGRAEQEYQKVCPPHGGSGGGGGGSGGSQPVPGTRCYIVYIYGPPSPTDGQPTVIRYYQICI